MKIEVNVRSVKMLREALCLAEVAMTRTDINIADSAKRHVADLIKELDKHRPLGPDGKHGIYHTPTCGCTYSENQILRINRLIRGDWSFGCGGMHGGNGSTDCPVRLHHHHDIFCSLPTIEELRAAGIDPSNFRAKSRR